MRWKCIGVCDILNSGKGQKFSNIKCIKAAVNMKNLVDECKKVLIIHGWMHSAERYYELKKDIQCKTDYEVDLYEFPGFGSTSPKYEKNILSSYVTDLKDYLQNNEYNVIIAHSMGGNAVLKALESEKNGTKLILLSPEYYGIPLLRPLIIFKPLLKLGFRFMKKPFKLNEYIIRLTALLTINKWSAIDELIVKDVKRANPDVATELMFELAYDDWRAGKWCGNRKVVVIIGENDRIIKRKHIRLLKRDLESCDVKIITNIGHTAVLENYEEVSGLIMENM